MGHSTTDFSFEILHSHCAELCSETFATNSGLIHFLVVPQTRIRGNTGRECEFRLDATTATVLAGRDGKYNPSMSVFPPERLWQNTKVPALVVRQRNTLRRHFELDHSGGGPQVAAQRGVGSLGDGLRAGQGLSLHRVQVEDVAG